MSAPEAAPAPTHTGTVRAYDGTRLFVQGWPVEEAPPRSIVLIVHGYAEHCGRYRHVAAHLGRHGHAVYAYDQRGHGRSAGRRAFVRSFDQYVVDLHHVLRRVRAQAGEELPLFLLGHSMGGLVSALYSIDHGARPAGLVLSSPAVHINPELAPLLRKLAEPVGRLLPTLPTVKLAHGTLTHDAALGAWAEADPLNYHGRTLARTGAEILRAGARVLAGAHRLTVPLLIFHGTGDRLAAPAASRRLYQRAASADKTLTLYEGFYHETLNEVDRARVLCDLARWLDERTQLARARSRDVS